jgi:S1-C subfamily serine protease
MNLHSCIVSVSLVIQIRAGNVIGSASGFFYKRQGILFLVTNSHVCRHDPTGAFPDLLRLKLHSNPNDLTANADYDVPLYSQGLPLWKTPPSHPSADVALLKLDINQIANRFTITHWEPNNLFPPKYQLNPGEDVFLMGYPHGFHDTVHNLPVFRNAMIASAHRVPFQGAPMFLTDANLHPGTSGSPVLSKPKNIWVDEQGNSFIDSGTVYYLLGVHLGTYDLTVGTPPRKIPLGLGAAWYADLVEETAATF